MKRVKESIFRYEGKRGTTYHVRIAAGTDPKTGERSFINKGGFSTLTDAKEWRDRQLAHKGSHAIRAGKIAFGKFLEDQWFPTLEARRLRLTTQETYRNNALYIGELGAVPIEKITAPMLNALYADLLRNGRKHGKRGLAPKTVNHVHRLIHKALADALKWGIVTRNVAAQADPPKIEKRVRPVWSAAQLRQFVEFVGEDRLAAAWVLWISTGMRRGEVAGLSWAHLDLEAGNLQVAQTMVIVGRKPLLVESAKTDESRRTISLDQFTVSGLKAHKRRMIAERMAAGLGWDEQALVFTEADGSRIMPDLFTDQFHKLAKEAGLPRIRLHDLRHSYATAALEAGIPLKVVSERLGHADIKITADLYQHVSPALDKDAAETVARLIFGEQ